MLVLRQYQEELIGHAKKGANVIICAPTGSGKTYLCIPLIERALKQSPDKAVHKICFQEVEAPRKFNF